MAEVKTSTKTTVVPLRLSAIRGNNNREVQTTTAGRVKGPGSTEVTKAPPIKNRTMKVDSIRMETTQTSHKVVGVNRGLIKGSPEIDHSRRTTGLATNATTYSSFFLSTL